MPDFRKKSFFQQGFLAFAPVIRSGKDVRWTHQEKRGDPETMHAGLIILLSLAGLIVLVLLVLFISAYRIDFDKIYREDSKCTFTDLKIFVSAYIENFKSHVICNNELFIEPVVNNVNDTKTLDVSMFYKLIHPEPNSVYADILLIVEKMDFS